MVLQEAGGSINHAGHSLSFPSTFNVLAVEDYHRNISRELSDSRTSEKVSECSSSLRLDSQMAQNRLIHFTRTQGLKGFIQKVASFLHRVITTLPTK